MRGAVHNIDLTARDLARSAAFYEEALGFLGYRHSRGDAPPASTGICATRGVSSARSV